MKERERKSEVASQRNNNQSRLIIKLRLYEKSQHRADIGDSRHIRTLVKGL